MWKLILLLFLYKIVLAKGLPNEVDTRCVLNITGSQNFTECVMRYSMFISNASSFVDLSDPYSMMTIMCSTEGKAAIQCVVEYVKSCPDLMNSGNSSLMLQGLQTLEQFGGLETYCNSTSAFGLPHGCTLDIVGNQSFIECMMGYSMLISLAGSFVDLNDPNAMMAVTCSTEGQAAMQCVLEYVQTCPDLMNAGNSSSVLQGLQELEQFGGLESYCNSSSAISLSHGCAPAIAENQSFIECVMGYSVLITNASNFLDLNDPNAMLSILCSTEGQAAMRCVLEYLKSCPDLINSGNSSAMLQGLQALEQFGGLETYCNTTSVFDQPHGCAVNVAGNKSFTECVMRYSMLISIAASFVDVNDSNTKTAIMCSTEGKTAIQCVLGYVKACPDLMNVGHYSPLFQDVQVLEEFGGLESYCNTTTATGLPHGCVPGIAGNQSFIQCVMGYSMLMSNAANFMDLNDQNAMMSLMCSKEGKAALQCVLDHVKSCPDLMTSGNSSSMLQGLQTLEQFGGLEAYCNNTSGTGLPHGCALDIAGNQSFIDCVMGYSMLMSNAANFMDLNDPNSMMTVMCSTEGKAAIHCIVEYVKSCPDLMNSGQSSFILQDLQALEQFGGLETYCNTTSDADECMDETDNCSENAFCINTVWGYNCICDATKGFYGDGMSCSKVICNPDDSIDIYNLPVDYYYFAMQNVTGGPDVQCTITNINSTAVTITGCAKDLPILLTFGTYSGMEAHALHGGKSMIAVTIKCNEIPETGNVHSVRNSFIANLTVAEKAYIKPYYEVTSALNTTSAIVGSPVRWTISFPREYILEVTECKAFPGTSNTSSNSVTLVTNGGCNATSELISHFTDNLDGTVTSTIAAFKFHDHDNIFLTCDLKICPNASSSCNTSCSREKRSVKQFRGARENKATEARAATVHNVLKIVNNFASASPLFSEWLILTFIIWCL